MHLLHLEIHLQFLHVKAWLKPLRPMKRITCFLSLSCCLIDFARYPEIPLFGVSLFKSTSTIFGSSVLKYLLVSLYFIDLSIIEL